MNGYERFEQLQFQSRETTSTSLSAGWHQAEGLFEVLLKTAFEEVV